MKVLPRYVSSRALPRQLKPIPLTTRSFFTTTPVMAAAAAAKPRFAEGSDEQLLTEALDGLVSKRWALTADGQGVERSFRFKTFAKTWVSSNDSPARG